MLEKMLIKCDQNCSACNLNCEIREKEPELNLNHLFEDVSNQLQLFTYTNVVKSLTSSISLLRDDEASQMIFIADCIGPHVKYLLQKAKIDKAKKDLVASNLNGFLYHIADKIILKSKKNLGGTNAN